MGDKIDVSRLNRHERRKLGKQFGGKILGRNLPYVKNIHGSIEEYNRLRAEEIKLEEQHIQ